MKLLTSCVLHSRKILLLPILPILQSRSCLGRVQPPILISALCGKGIYFPIGSRFNTFHMIHFLLWVLSIPLVGAHWFVHWGLDWKAVEYYTCPPSHMTEDFLLLWNVRTDWRLLDMGATLPWQQMRATNIRATGNEIDHRIAYKEAKCTLSFCWHCLTLRGTIQPSTKHWVSVTTFEQ